MLTPTGQSNFTKIKSISHKIHDPKGNSKHNLAYFIFVLIKQAFRRNQNPISSDSFNRGMSGDVLVTSLSFSFPPLQCIVPLRPPGKGAQVAPNAQSLRRPLGSLLTVHMAPCPA